MRVRLLGPVDVLVEGAVRPVSGLRRQAVLAALALQAGDVVSTDRLVDIVWGDDAPPTAATTLQNHVSHLRGVLGRRSAIMARSPGYLLDIKGGATDLQEAERLIREGTHAPDAEHRERQLLAAVALWRGDPLAGLTDLAWFRDHALRLDHLLLQARHALLDARLTLGQHGELVPELEALSRRHPLDEQIHRQLIVALYRAGRQGDALTTYQRLRHNLKAELGIDPSQPLRELEAAVLRQDAGLDVTAPPINAAARPAQLPPAIAAFTGRTRETAQLDRLRPRGGRSAPPAVTVISAISGTAGIGKTMLAVQWAHRVAAQFPDGQLYVNLRGFDPSGQVVNPADALRVFLEAFGMPAHQIPAGLEAQVGLYRSTLAGKQVLVVLDNARDVEQVRPLLPGSNGCMVIVTSRNQLTPLVASEGAHLVTLDLLTPAEARDLLRRRLGADRVAGEPQAVDDIVSSCARLPLALAIAAARAATHPDFPLATLAAEMRDAEATLDPFQGGDPATDIRAVLSWSYRTLTPAAARLFRLIGLHPGPDLTALAAASMAAASPQQTNKLLAELTQAHLLREHMPGRYTFHDLLRAYAIEQAHADEDDEQRHAAVHRMLDHYLHTIAVAAVQLFPRWDPIALPQPLAGVAAQKLEGPDPALAWLTAEYPALVGIIELAAATEFGAHAWQLAWFLTTYLQRAGIAPEQTSVQHLALAAARREEDLIGQSLLLRSLAMGYERGGRPRDAETYFRQALQICIDLGNHESQAHVYVGLASSAEKQGRPAVALDYAQRSLDMFRVAADETLVANALNGVGWCHARLGNFEQALTYCTQSLDMSQEIGDIDGQANAWDSLGHVHSGLGDHARAADCFQHSIDLSRELGDRYYEADSLTNLGDIHRDAGNPDEARKGWQQALQIMEKLNHPGADEIRTKLNTLKVHPRSG
jgi:DNA-binding SARP family transcriptional activator/tetratricopeptide (TPR) repeat protein